ncbi:hypothetical protein [Aneurinibacillus uraniidurans]|uniref:hypothetical protein n=1 Tax=Aneurinibacillus uraniidurans TaxID=2966586 RepID=UPI00234B5883|nr:hypothetical protein [Aneurinibacillus sp. B1]WCN37560.1 hypothetical protein PO771_17510 [Aneurinibacillus sp. B1]
MKRQFSMEFKVKVVKQALKSDRNTTARNYHLNSIMISRWIREYSEGKYDRVLI